jgi:hypothetical protein
LDSETLGAAPEVPIPPDPDADDSTKP